MQVGDFTIDRCRCGAITVETPKFVNSMRPETFKADYPDLPLPEPDKISFYCCDYCFNKWGTDLCGCGSGEPLGECGEGHEECRSKTPAQVKGETKRFTGWRF